MDKLISEEGQRRRRRLLIESLDLTTLESLVEAADEYMVAGLCNGSSPDEFHELLKRLRDAGLADS